MPASATWKSTPGPKFAALALLGAGEAAAHSFAQPYQLPMPYWMYIYGAVAALALSFVVVGLFVGAGAANQPAQSLPLGDSRAIKALRRLRLLHIAKLLSVMALLLCIASGLLGTRDPYRNINMTFFWLVFALGFSYFTALFGNWYAVLNPWKLLAEGVGKCCRNFIRGRFRYPPQLAYWPALALYMAFIWLELLGNTRPFSLSVALLVYSLINLAGVYLVGLRSWFQYCEFFAVFMRLLALLAPLRYRPDATGPQRLCLRWPGAGILEERAEHFSLLLFLLFMLSSTAFDGLRETALWFNLFWKDPTGIVEWLAGKQPMLAYPWLRPWYVRYESLWIVASPFLYLALFWLFLGLGKWLTRSPMPVSQLALHFAYSLLPIVLVYHFTHYYTLLLSQGVKIRALISDPFGWGWDLFGTAHTLRAPLLPDMGLVWNIQVWMILLGHVASVYLAHRIALQLFPSQRQATLSQLPMLMLMVLFTGAGLWILAQPLQGN